MTEVAGQFLVLVGSLFVLLAAVGVLRFPDVLTRLQASTKASTLGIGSIMIGAAIYSHDLAISLKCVLILAFVLRTSPVAAHLIARSALRDRKSGL